jgi:DNA-directed RNA polymerase subunit RPC12/RpoP
VKSIHPSKKYHCPRCGNKILLEYVDSFDCAVCGLEFEKQDCVQQDVDSEILSVEEKMAFIKAHGIDPKDIEEYEDCFKDEE